jgi:hypothetical protein
VLSVILAAGFEFLFALGDVRFVLDDDESAGGLGGARVLPTPGPDLARARALVK